MTMMRRSSSSRRTTQAAAVAAVALAALLVPAVARPDGAVPEPYDRSKTRPVSIEEKIRLIEREYKRVARENGLPDNPVNPSGSVGPQADQVAVPIATNYKRLSELKPVESDHYRFYSDADPELVRGYAKQMEAFFAKFCHNFTFDGKLKKKNEVWLYHSQKTFMEREDKPQNVGGFYTPGNGRVTVFHGRFGMSGDTKTVLAHEGTHQFQHLVAPNIFRHAPTWIIEGLAVFFESARYDGKKVHVGEVPRDRLIVVQRAIKAGNHVPIEKLINTKQPQFTGFHYAHAWSVIYWFVYTHPKNQAIFKRYWDLCRNKGSRVTQKDFEDVIGVSITELEEKWKEWVLELKPGKAPRRD